MTADGHLSALRQVVAALMSGEDIPEEVNPPTELVRRHLLGPLAHRFGLSGHRDDFGACAVAATAREQQLGEAINALSEQEIPVILLKGVSYSSTLYRVPALRPMVDIDLMIPAELAEEAVDTLTSLGYQRSSKGRERSSLSHAITLGRDATPIDLHRTIAQPLRTSIDLTAVWQRAAPASERTDGALRLDQVDETVFHLLHIARHELAVAAIAYVDAMRLLARLGPARVRDVRARARAWRAGAAIDTVLAMVDTLAAGDPGLPRTIRWALMPRADEIMRREHVGRPVQLARKAALTEGPIELAGLAAGYVIELWSAAGAVARQRA